MEPFESWNSRRIFPLDGSICNSIGYIIILIGGVGIYVAGIGPYGWIGSMGVSGLYYMIYFFIWFKF